MKEDLNNTPAFSKHGVANDCGDHGNRQREDADPNYCHLGSLSFVDVGQSIEITELCAAVHLLSGAHGWEEKLPQLPLFEEVGAVGPRLVPTTGQRSRPAERPGQYRSSKGAPEGVVETLSRVPPADGWGAWRRV